VISHFGLGGEPVDAEVLRVALELEHFAVKARRRLRQRPQSRPRVFLEQGIELLQSFADEVLAAGKKRRRFVLVSCSCGVRALPGVTRCPACGEARS
jgi:hypothetical protein